VSSNEAIERALKMPNGAQFRRCALHIHPFKYIPKHNKQTVFRNERNYNDAIIAACRHRAIDVIGVVDHHCIDDSLGLIAAAEAAGITVFPGLELNTKDGVHFLCLFEPGTDADTTTRILGNCGLCDREQADDSSRYYVDGLLAAHTEWGVPCICIAAHLTDEAGLLKRLKNQHRVKAWTHPDLLAGSIRGRPDEETDYAMRRILLNEDDAHKRQAPLALVNASDVYDPEKLDWGGWCYIKMSQVSVEGLRQAFLDPESRIRLRSKDQEHEPKEPTGARLLAVAYDTPGFLKDCTIHFNDNLNVLIGGRGTGKSTVIESLRYALQLEPQGSDAAKNHQDIIKKVVRPGTRISLLVHVPRFQPAVYRVECTVPNPPEVVEHKTGKASSLTAHDLLPGMEVYGQHEIAEMASDPQLLTPLLRRFMPRRDGLEESQDAMLQQLRQTRQRILDTTEELEAVQSRLEALPGLEEAYQRLRQSGLEEHLEDQRLLAREEQVLKTATDRAAPMWDTLQDLRDRLPLDRAFVSDKALDGLPGKPHLAPLHKALDELESETSRARSILEEALRRFDVAVAGVRSRWAARKRLAEEDYHRLLRELQTTDLDGEELRRIAQWIEQLRPLRERQTVLEQTLREHRFHRGQLLAEWEQAQQEHLKDLRQAAKDATRQLKGWVRMEVHCSVDHRALEGLLRDKVGGRLVETLDRLQYVSGLSLIELAGHCRKGAAALVDAYRITSGQADQLAQAGEQLFMQLEELPPAFTTHLCLNVGTPEAPEWKKLEDLSKGQKATAILLLLLQESDAPLVVDQPEDDLDNRFITEVIVPRIRQVKNRRQLTLSTHNANIPVLGDAELILGLEARGEGEHGRVIADGHRGSIDHPGVKQLVEDLLEGGQAAFENRRKKYGF